jgi:uncharacterized SAM-binding protein YcdF (DUF218 family)
MTHRPRRWRALALTGLAALLLGWSAVVVGVLVMGRRDAARPADAIVVLGAAQYVGRPSPVLRARLDHALVLWRRGLAPQLIVTGGRGEGDTTSEAEVSRRYVVRRGVPDSAIVLENEGRTTSESLRAVATFMAPRPSKRVILVSDPFHMFRLSLLARRFGLEPYTSPTRTSPISARPGQSLRYVLNESVKVPLAFIFERTIP